MFTYSMENSDGWEEMHGRGRSVIAYRRGERSEAEAVWFRGHDYIALIERSTWRFDRVQCCGVEVPSGRLLELLKPAARDPLAHIDLFADPPQGANL